MPDTSSINRVYFNELGKEYDEKFQRTLNELEEEIRRSKDFIGAKDGGRLLDYACGTGLLTCSLGDSLDECVGVDISETMVAAFNAKIKSKAASSGNKQAFLGNLMNPSEPHPDTLAEDKFFNFDIAGVALGFHHFDDPELAAKRLAERLAPGGVLFILDFVPNMLTPKEGMSHSAVHSGFSEEQIRGCFESAGVGKDFKFMEVDRDIVFHNLPHNHHHQHQHQHQHSHHQSDNQHQHSHHKNENQHQDHDDAHHSHGGKSLARRIFLARGTKV